MENKNIENINIQSAIKTYIRQRDAIKRWQQKKPEKQRVYSKSNYDKMKNSDHEKYKAMLARKKTWYKKKKKNSDPEKHEAILARKELIIKKII